MGEAGNAAAGKLASGWDIYGMALSDDPHARWAELRREQPVLDAGGGVFFVSRWDLVDEVLRDARHRAGSGVSASFGATQGLGFEAMRVWLMSLDGPEQTRARGLVRREFTPRQIEVLRPRIERTADELVSELEAAPRDSEVDLIAALAFPLPSQVIRSLFGIPEGEWAREIEQTLKDPSDDAEAGLRMIESLARYFDRRVESGNLPPGLLSQLSLPDAELGALSRLEVIANAVLLVTAAIDTTAGLLGNAISCLIQRPVELERIRADRSLIPAVVEETLRFEPPALSCSRTAGVDLELGGVSIPAGSQILLGLGAANRDPARYAEPDRFDLDRDHTGGLSFGGGRHFCLGAALARLEARIVLERLFVEGSIDLRATEAPRWQKRNPTVRALETLPVRVTPRSK